ncbi:MAG: extra-cytoplasmic solute receptor family protein [Betaproteobacteria bacterium]|nr:extra-cytoplasmic solute receptor family protein [Betaproteobacteria bacterium]
MTKINICSLSTVFCALALWPLGAAAAQGSQSSDESYPTRPIRLVVPFAPGGSSDTITRLIGPRLGEQLGHQVVLDNRSGGNGAIGTQIVARAVPDGYTIGLAYIATIATNPAITGDVGYDPVKDFAAVTQLTSSANVLAIHLSVAASSVKELVALAKAKPGQLNYSSGGVGTIGHLSAELLQHAAGIKLNHIAYKGSGQAVIDLVGGHVGIMFSGMAAVAGHAKAGKLKLLAVTGKQRMPIAPDIPTIAESGYPGFEAVGWFGLVAPVHTPRALISRLNAETVKAANVPDVREKLTAIGFDVVTSTPEAFARYIQSEVVKWRQVAKQMGLKPE